MSQHTQSIGPAWSRLTPPTMSEERIIDYVPDPEPVCYACRKERHEYCIEKKGFECWCEEEDTHGQ